MGTVVAISGVSGGGKSSIANALAERFANSRLLNFDDYTTSSRWYPEWLAEGGDRLAAALEWRKSGCDPNRAVTTPGLLSDICESRSEVALVIVEEPFGRLRSEMDEVIDLSIHIDTPLDVALARKVVRDASLRDPIGFLEIYLNTGLRTLYLTSSRAKERADVVIDGLQPLALCITQAEERLSEI